MTVDVRLLGVCASPRRGNSWYLLEEALAGAGSVPGVAVKAQAYSFRGRKIAPCLACGACIKAGGRCQVDDDFAELRDLWLEADAVLYSVPVYHLGVPAQLKAFMDRLGQSLFGHFRHLFPPERPGLPRLLKAIGCLAQGAHFASGQEHAIMDVIQHALVMQCVPVAGDLWQSYLGAGGWTRNQGGVDALRRQAAEGHLEARAAVEAARAVGRRAVEVAALIRAGLTVLGPSLGDLPAYRALLKEASGAQDGGAAGARS
ncbi:MAG: flavodoxin family protein [Acetobacteraceae bacterium]|nr:flavodoxin family protein [Acetobacteraceae bacterium]